MRKRILVLTSRLPYPVVGGDRLRVYQFLRQLVEEFDVDLVSMHESEMAAEDGKHLRTFLANVVCFHSSPWFAKGRALWNMFVRGLPLQVGYYYSSALQQWVNTHHHKYDLIFCFHARMAEYVRNLHGKKIVDLVDAVSLNYTRALGQALRTTWRVVYKIELPMLRRYEIDVVRRFDKTVIISEVDKKFLVSTGADGERISVIPNGTSFLETTPSGSVEGQDIDILFFGHMNTQANDAAALFFLEKVHSLLKTSSGTPRMYVVGPSPSKRLRRHANGNDVIVTGEVPDVMEYLTRSKVVIAPMTFGAGVQNKVLESMAMAKPVVLTTLGAEGIDAIDGVHYLVADQPEQFARAVASLLQNQSLRAKMGEAARSFIAERFSWENVGDLLRTEVSELLQ